MTLAYRVFCAVKAGHRTSAEVAKALGIELRRATNTLWRLKEAGAIENATWSRPTRYQVVAGVVLKPDGRLTNRVHVRPRRERIEPFNEWQRPELEACWPERA